VTVTFLALRKRGTINVGTKLAHTFEATMTRYMKIYHTLQILTNGQLKGMPDGQKLVPIYHTIFLKHKYVNFRILLVI